MVTVLATVIEAAADPHFAPPRDDENKRWFGLARTPGDEVSAGARFRVTNSWR
jgi:hypothetical protein